MNDEMIVTGEPAGTEERESTFTNEEESVRTGEDGSTLIAEEESVLIDEEQAGEETELDIFTEIDVEPTIWEKPIADYTVTEFLLFATFLFVLASFILNNIGGSSWRR